MPERNVPIDVRVTLARSITVLGWWMVGLYVVVAILSGILFINAAKQREALAREVLRINTSLCTFTADLQARADNTVKFLQDNPGQEPIPGISRETLLTSLENQRRTLKSLRELDCNELEDKETSVLGQEVAGHASPKAVINTRRSNNDCKPLKSARSELIESARRHSKAMARAGHLFHSELRANGWSKVGEVVGVGPTWRSIVRALFRSQEHRRILLDCSYDVIAIGLIYRDGYAWLTGRLYAR